MKPANATTPSAKKSEKSKNPDSQQQTPTVHGEEKKNPTPEGNKTPENGQAADETTQSAKGKKK